MVQKEMMWKKVICYRTINSINSDVDATSIYAVLELVHKDEYTERGGGRHTLCWFPARTLSK